MRTMMRILGPVLIGSVLAPASVNAQVTLESNTILGGQYVGCDAGSNQPLRFTTVANYPHIWRTNNAQRMRLNQNVSSAVNGYGTTAKNGFLGLSPDGSLWQTGPGIFSRLHLDDATGVLTSTYRPWMKNGVYMSGNNDMMYVGQLYRAGYDEGDAVIAWGDNKFSPAGPDHLRFIFMGDGYEGEEVTRINGEGFHGLGNFDAAGVNPDERLDLLNRTARLRRLIPDYNNDTIGRVVVVDTTGRLHWRRINTWPSTGTGTADCKWTLLGTGNANIATAYAGNPGCPQYDRFVGIGTNAPSAKLHVRWTGTSGNANASAFAIDGSSYGKRGADISVAGTGSLHAGLRAIASGASSALNVEGNMGVHGRAEATVSVARNRGLFSEALVSGASVVGRNIGLEVVSDGNPGTTATENYGVLVNARSLGASTNTYGGKFVASASDPTATVYGVWASGGGGNSSNWAGWFDGDVKITNTLTVNTTVYTSDESLKTNIEPAPACLPVIEALLPRRYNFTPEASEALGLDQTQRIGLIAQELEQVVPSLVHEVTMPAEFDSLGNEASAQWSYKGVDYVSLIPYLIGAVKELSSQNTLMQQQLAACCANPDTGERMAPGTGSSDPEGVLSPAQERLLRIAPNPFIDRTTLYCQLERAGRVQLIANSADGRDLRVLSEAQREAGAFQYEWSTEQLAPGVYYVTLLLDGEPLAQRAVKVGR